MGLRFVGCFAHHSRGDQTCYGIRPIACISWGITLVLVSPGFCRNLGSGGEPECLHFIGVLSFDDEFREAVTWGGIQEKFRHALA